MKARYGFVLLLFSATIFFGIVNGAIVSISPSPAPPYSPVTVTASAVVTPLTLDFAGAGQSSCAVQSGLSGPVSTPCSSSDLDDDPTQCALYTGDSLSLTGCIGGLPSYTFCIFNGQGNGFDEKTVTTAGAQGTCFGGWGYSGAINSALCGAYSTASTTILVLGLLLMVLGGAIFAGSHILPGQAKGGLQGYAMTMLIGGVIGIIISLLAPYILSILIGTSVPIC